MTVDHGAPGAQRKGAGEAAQDSRLSRPVGPPKGHSLPGAEIEVEVRHDRPRAEPPAEASDTQDRTVAAGIPALDLCRGGCHFSRARAAPPATNAPGRGLVSPSGRHREGRAGAG